ncbi:hypothetical protein AB0G54_07720 [Streptomyces yokosukanensis]|uniref:Uncharacterized protein n=1 Tax=Streptomyces guryensis TaxID=2886947 RepID=A0A9Q3Z883_9ACTN|nr:hypothetical protein [Streptomyces guryensis]MCD9878248.1 hypothetical protein [Streptomyces guryensis]
MTAQDVPEVGTVVVDTRSDQLGEVMGAEGPYVQLRPLGGGIEWDVPPRALREATTSDELRAKVREVNASRRWAG